VCPTTAFLVNKDQGKTKTHTRLSCLLTHTRTPARANTQQPYYLLSHANTSPLCQTLTHKRICSLDTHITNTDHTHITHAYHTHITHTLHVHTSTHISHTHHTHTSHTSHTHHTHHTHITHTHHTSHIIHHTYITYTHITHTHTHTTGYALV